MQLIYLIWTFLSAPTFLFLVPFFVTFCLGMDVAPAVIEGPTKAPIGCHKRINTYKVSRKINSILHLFFHKIVNFCKLCAETDAKGNQCNDIIEVNVCWGRCDTKGQLFSSSNLDNSKLFLTSQKFRIGNSHTKNRITPSVCIQDEPKCPLCFATAILRLELKLKSTITRNRSLVLAKPAPLATLLANHLHNVATKRNL